MALEIQVEELKYTMSTAKVYTESTDEKIATVYRGYIQDINEDIGLIERHKSSYGDKEKDILTLVAEARRQKRGLEKAAFVLENAAKKKEVPPPVVLPTKPAGMKLPRLKLPTFDGSRTEDFRGFIDAFNEALSGEPDLSGVRKWLLLKPQLTGKAFNLVKELPTAPETYTAAIKILEDAYGSPKRAIQRLYERMLALPEAEMKTESLRTTHAQLEGILLSLEGLGVSMEETFLRSVVMDKYPEEIVHLLRISDDTTLRQLRDEIGLYVKQRDCKMKKSTPQPSSRNEPKGNVTNGGADGFQRKQPRHAKSSLSSTGGASAPSEQVSDSKSKSKNKKVNERVNSCVFCTGSHWNDECTVHKTVEERLKLVGDRCQRCLQPQHESGECTSTRSCFFCKDSAHHSALCPKKFAKVMATDSTDVTGKPSKFITAVIPLSNTARTKQLEARAVLDTAGGRSLITAELAERLQLESTGEQVRFVGVNGASISDRPASSRRLLLVLPNGETIETIVFVVPEIVHNVEATSVADLKKRYPQYADLLIPPEGNGCPVQLLLGYRCLTNVVTLEKSIPLTTQLQLMSTKFGWIPFGGLTSTGGDDFDSSTVGLIKEVDPVRLMSDLELVGLGDFMRSENEEEALVLDKFYASIKREDKRYEVEWPYKFDNPELEDNFGLAFGRLVSLHRQLAKSPTTLAAYDRLIKEQLEENIVEPVNLYAKTAPGLVHYLPHRAIIRLRKSTPLRIVFDAAARSSRLARSLNDIIMKGGNWVSQIPAMLLRFRRYGVAVTSDISRAFHQIGIAPKDRDVVRFLWLRDPNLPVTRENICVYRFKRMAFGIVASPFLLTATIRHHLRTFPNQYADLIEQDLYADNLVTSLPRDVDCGHFYRVVKECFADMSMNIAQWASDFSPMQRQFSVADQISDSIVTVLGLEWNRIERTLRVRHPRLPTHRNDAPTKRIVLRELATVYDPLGWISPVVLLARIFLRKVWRKEYSWERVLTEELIEEWRAIRSRLNEVDGVALERAYGFGGLENADELQLHVFCDASQEAYGVAIYLCVREEERSWSGLVAAKTRLAPNSGLSIPRLELLAAVTASKFLGYVEAALKLTKPTTKYLWGDSRCVIAWTTSNKILPAFVEKSVRVVKEAQFKRFSYVPSAQNPADAASRGATMEELRRIEWWSGPSWLTRTESWPPQRSEPNEEEQAYNLAFNLQTEEEERVLLTDAILSAKKELNLNDATDSPFRLNPNDFSTFEKLLRRTTVCLQAASRFLRGRGTIRVTEQFNYEEAKVRWLVWDQQRFYAPAENEKANVSYLRNLRVSTDEKGLLRCHTRMQHARVNRDEAEPILLVRKSPLTRLVILSIHVRFQHVGTSHTLAALRQWYWLPHGRREVYQTIHQHCYVCRREDAQPFKARSLAALPPFRVNQTETPFQNVGVDAMGPFTVHYFVEEKKGSLVAKEKKVWILLFTCLVVRAVHLEILHDSQADEYLNAFRRFVGRRGVPRLIVSDNAPQFESVESAIRGVWNQFARAEKNAKYYAEHGIQWKFIAPHSPWMGGAYERLVREVKRNFEKVYGRVRLTERQFELALVEVEGVLNSRPITYVARGDDTELISPNDFLCVRYPAVPADFTSPLATSVILKSWRAGEEYLKQFWRLWSEDYLRSLRERRDIMKTGRLDEDRQPLVGELVLVIDPSHKRGSWEMAVVERLVTGVDGKVRAAQIRLPNRGRTVRPVVNLVPLRLIMDLPANMGELTENRRAIVVDNEGGELHFEEETPADPTPAVGTVRIPEREICVDEVSANRRPRAAMNPQVIVVDNTGGEITL